MHSFIKEVRDIRREFMYFFRTFTFTGILNILPQMFLIAYFPSQRSVLLPVFLTLYSVSGTTGLWYARRLHRREASISQSPPRLRQGLVLTVSLVINLVLFSLFKVHAWTLFLLFLVILAFTLEAAFNWFDHALTVRLDTTDLVRHSNRAAVAQLIGVCIAPIYFAFLYRDSVGTIVIPLVTLAFIGMVYWSLGNGATKLPEYTTTVLEKAQGVDASASHTRRIDVAFLLFVISVYCAAFIFASYGIFLLNDFYHVSNAITDGGWMIAVMNVSSIVGALGYGTFVQRRTGPESVLRGGAVATGVLLVAIVLFAAKLNLHLFYILGLASLAGLPYGCFLVMTREYASKQTAKTGNSVLSLYNMSADAAAITAFVITLVVTLSLGIRVGGGGHSTALIVIIVGFLLIALAAFAAFQIFNKRQYELSGKGVAQ